MCKLLIDFGTLDDIDSAVRAALARNRHVARPGAVFRLWCFYAAPRCCHASNCTVPPRMTPGIQSGEEQKLFGEALTIERLDLAAVRWRVSSAPAQTTSDINGYDIHTRD